MAFCSKCGSYMTDDARFCQNCGANRHRNEDEKPNLSPEETQNTGATDPSAAPADLPAPRSLNLVSMVWAIVNMVCCCTPLGIVSLILTVIAQDTADDEKRKKFSRSALICNIIGTAICVLLCVVYIVLIVAGVLTAAEVTPIV